MDENFFDRSLFNISRLTIIIPLFVLAAGVFIRVSQNRTVSTNARGNTRPTEVIISPAASIQSMTVTPTNEPINLEGPLECTFSTGDKTGIVYIKSKKIFADIVSSTKLEHQKLLINGDNAYMWEGTKGQRMNGVGQYLGLFNMLGGSHLFDIDMLLSMLPGDSGLPSSSTLNSLTKSCVKKDINDSLFIVPTSVQFIDTAFIKP